MVSHARNPTRPREKHPLHARSRGLIDQLADGHTPDLRRLARYGLNNDLTHSKCPGLDAREPYDRPHKVSRPSDTVHFLTMTEGNDGSDFALSDHVHAES